MTLIGTSSQFRRITMRALKTLIPIVALALRAGSSFAADFSKPVAFDIPPQLLSSALVQFADQAGVQFTAPGASLDGLRSQGVHGKYLPTRALALLLRRTGLGYRIVDQGTVAITLPGAPAAPASSAPAAGAGKEGKTGSSARFRMAGVAQGPTQSVPSLTAGGAGSEGQNSSTDSANALEVIVVTAQRRRENENNVPVAITALTGTDLKEKAVATLSDLQNFVPSLNVLGSFDRDDYVVTIRGMGPTAGLGSPLGGGGNGVVSYFADVPIESAGPGLFYDLQNVQVLNGPQGTLFGKNTTGGAILFVPNEPTNAFDANIDIDGGDYGMRSATAVVNLPIVDDKVLLRVAVTGHQENGFTRDRGPDFTGKQYDNQDYWGGRVSLVLRPTANFENYTIFSYLRNQNRGDGFVLSAVDPAGTYAAQLLPYLAQQEAAGIRSTSLDTDTIDNRLRYGVYNTSKWTISDNVQAKDIFSYQVSKWRNAEDLDGSPFELLDNIGPATGWHEQTGDFTDEVQLQGTSLNKTLQWTVGGYYEHDHTLGPQPYKVTFDYFTVLQPDSPNFGRDKAGYGQLTYDLGGMSDALQGVKLTAGYRYTWDEYGFGISLYSPDAGNACFTAAGVYPTSNCLFIDNSGRSSGASWTLGLEDQVDPDTLIYLRSAQGYIPGGFNPNIGYTGSLGSSIPQYHFLPETDIDVELGMKSLFSLAGMQGNIDADVFQTYFSNIQRSVAENILNKFGVIQNVGFVTNASEAIIRGFEFQGTIIPFRDLKLGLTYSYNDGKYTKLDPLAAPLLAGIPFAQLPKHKIGLNGTYTLPLDRKMGLVELRADYSYQSQVFDGSKVEPYAFVQAYGLLNLRLDWDSINQSSFDVSAFVTNATNKEYRVSQFGSYSENGYVASLYGAPRMFGAELRYGFE